jgi:hypothetical protein
MILDWEASSLTSGQSLPAQTQLLKRNGLMSCAPSDLTQLLIIFKQNHSEDVLSVRSTPPGIGSLVTCNVRHPQLILYTLYLTSRLQRNLLS